MTCVHVNTAYAPFPLPALHPNSRHRNADVCVCVSVVRGKGTSARRRGVRHAPGASWRRRLEVSNAAGRHVAAGRVLREDVGRLGHVLDAAAAVPRPAIGFAAGLGREVLGDVLRRVGGGGARGCAGVGIGVGWGGNGDVTQVSSLPIGMQLRRSGEVMLNTNDNKTRKHLNRK